MGRGQSAVSQVAVTSTSSPGRRTVALDGLVVMTRLPGGLPWYRPRHAEGLGDSAQAAAGPTTTGRTITEPAVTTMRTRRGKGNRRMGSPREEGGVLPARDSDAKPVRHQMTRCATETQYGSAGRAKGGVSDAQGLTSGTPPGQASGTPLARGGGGLPLAGIYSPSSCTAAGSVVGAVVVVVGGAVVVVVVVSSGGGPVVVVVVGSGTVVVVVGSGSVPMEPPSPPVPPEGFSSVGGAVVVVVGSGSVVVVVVSVVLVVPAGLSRSFSFCFSFGSSSAVVTVVEGAGAGSVVGGVGGTVVVVGAVEARLGIFGTASAIAASTFVFASCFSPAGTLGRSLCTSSRAFASAFGLSLALTASFSCLMSSWVSWSAGESTGRPTV